MIVGTAPAALPTLNGFRFDVPVLFSASRARSRPGIVIGLLPAVRSGQADPADALRANSYTATDGPRGGRARRVLVGAQAAIGAALLVTTGLLVLSFARLMHVEKGFDTAGILTIDVALPPSTFIKARAAAALLRRRDRAAAVRCRA